MSGCISLKKSISSPFGDWLDSLLNNIHKGYKIEKPTGRFKPFCVSTPQFYPQLLVFHPNDHPNPMTWQHLGMGLRERIVVRQLDEFTWALIKAYICKVSINSPVKGNSPIFSRFRMKHIALLSRPSIDWNRRITRPHSSQAKLIASLN